jgi:xanthine dehydrogenase accessory factor
VFLEPLERGRDTHYLDRLLDARRAQTPLLVTTDIATGARTVFEPGSNLPADAEASLAGGESRLVERPEGAVFVQALLPPVRIVIAGATNIGQVLADMARQAGYDVVVIDPRGAFLTAERFAGLKTIGAWPALSLSEIGLDARTAVVALTHAAHINDEALGTALRSPCLYVRALGSRRMPSASSGWRPRASTRPISAASGRRSDSQSAPGDRPRSPFRSWPRSLRSSAELVDCEARSRGPGGQPFRPLQH